MPEISIPALDQDRRRLLKRTGALMLTATGLPVATARKAGTGSRWTGADARPWFASSVPAWPAASAGQRTTSPLAHPLWNAPQRLMHWARQTVRLVVKYQQNPLRAARALTYVQVAMHDAWWHVRRMGGDAPASELGAHRAASLLMEQLYPLETPGQFEAQFAAITASLHPLHRGEKNTRGLALHVGRAVGEALMARSLRDGAGRVWPVRERPAPFTGLWKPAPPLYTVNPVEAFAPQWLTWLPPEPGRYSPPTAHRPGSAAHAAETREVLEVSRTLTGAQRQAALDWHLDAGSVTPVGLWMQTALTKLQHRMPQEEALGADAQAQALPVLAALSVAMFEGLVACWQVKLRDWSERPITAVRRDLDPHFEPLLVTPGFPSYVSGHATVSAAAACVLGSFWPEQDEELAAMAQEAAMSRLWGGLHFRSDNDEGLRLGRAVGQAVLAHGRQT